MFFEAFQIKGSISSLALLISMKQSLEMSVIDSQLLTPSMFRTKRYCASCV